MKEIKRRSVLKYCFYSAIIIKIVFSLFIGNKLLSSQLELKFNFWPEINNDERAYSTVAYNYNDGIGFSYTERENYFIFGTKLSQRPTAYRPTFPILIHIIYQKVFFPNVAYEDVANKSSDYLKTYALIVNLISLLLFLISIPFFKQLTSSFISNETGKYITTILYILFPSSLVFVGLMPSYENITLPIFVIILSKLYSVLSKKISNFDIIVISGLATMITLLRPHMTISLFLIFGFVAFTLLRNFNRRLFLLLSVTFLGVGISNGLILIKNNYVIGAPVLSTQQSRAFFLGNNPYARGSWNGHASNPEDPMFLYRKDRIKNFTATSDELYLYDEHNRLAKEWILSYPMDFFILCGKKIAMHFLPYNYEYLKFNLINFIVNIGALLSMIYLTVFYKKINALHILLLLTILGTFLMAIYSFFNYRYMYYIYPSFILLSVYFYKEIIVKFIKKWN